MSMHGMTKEEYLASRTEENLKKKQVLGLEWKEKFARIIEMKKQGEFIDEGLQLTTRLLDFNSDCYTLWNMRRLILLRKVREANEEQARLAIEAEQRVQEETVEEEVNAETESNITEEDEAVDAPATQEDDTATESTETQTDEPKSEGKSESGNETTKDREQEELQQIVFTRKRPLTEEEKKQRLDQRRKELDQAKVDRLRTMLETELDSITKPAIKRNPKSYWPWNHRVWCMEQLEGILPATADSTEETKDLKYFLGRELGLCDLFLKLDGRNFHCWNYRSFIAEKAGLTLQQELAFTEQKIGEGGSFFFASAGGKQSFSNYSAWHLRSKVLGQLWDDMLANGRDDEYWQSIEDEFGLLEQSLVMHDGESPWQYHRWLMAKVPSERKEHMIHRELELIDEIIRTDQELTPDKPPKWAMLSKVYLLQELAEIKGKDEHHKEQTIDLINKLVACDPFRKNYYAHLLDKYQKSS